MSDLEPITREEALLDGADLEPITRKEQFIKRIYDKTQEIPDPITREEWFLKKAGEGASPVTIEQLNATENGTYSEQGKAYSPVIVEVPEPTLITKSITANGTYTASADNADGYSQVTVAVDGFKKKSIANTPTDIASFADGTANPMPSLEISIDPVQSGSGDPSPSNVRPISGWSGANVTKCGVNLFDYRTAIEGYYISNSNGSIAQMTGSACTDFISVCPGSTYVISPKLLSGNWGAWYDNNKRFIFGITGYNTPYVAPSNARYIRFTLNYSNSNPDYADTAQLELGSTVTTYSPYQGSTLSIPFHDNSDNPITVYGGTLNVTSGELSVDRSYVEINENSDIVAWDTPQSPWVGFYYVPSPYMQSGRTTDLKCNYLKSVDSTIGWNIYGVYRTLYLIFDENVIGGRTIDDVKGFLETHPLQVVYPLDTPQTYQLTPTQVSTLLEQNNIFADCGQVLEGEYFVTL